MKKYEWGTDIVQRLTHEGQSVERIITRLVEAHDLVLNDYASSIAQEKRFQGTIVFRIRNRDNQRYRVIQRKRFPTKEAAMDWLQETEESTIGDVMYSYGIVHDTETGISVSHYRVNRQEK